MIDPMLQLKEASDRQVMRRHTLPDSPFTALYDHIIVKLCPKQTKVGSIELTDVTAAQRLYGMVLSIGPVADPEGRLKPGDMIMFSQAGRQTLKLSDMETEDYIAIGRMMGLCKVDPNYVLSQDLELPTLEVDDAQQDEKAGTVHEAVQERAEEGAKEVPA